MRSPVRASVFASVGMLSNVKAAKTTSKLPGANSPAMLVTNKVVLSRRVDRACLIQHCLRDICADDVKSEISKESSRSAGAAAEVERTRAVVIAANQGRQIAEREIVRSRKLKCRIGARPFLIFVHVGESAVHLEMSGCGRGVSGLAAQTSTVTATVTSARITLARIQSKIAPKPQFLNLIRKSYLATVGHGLELPAFFPWFLLVPRDGGSAMIVGIADQCCLLL